MDDATSTPSPTTKPSGMALGEEGIAKRDNEQIQKEAESEIKAKRVKRELAEEMQKLEEAETELIETMKERIRKERLAKEEEARAQENKARAKRAERLAKKSKRKLVEYCTKEYRKLNEGKI